MSCLTSLSLTSHRLTSHQALQLAADFAFTADYMRTAESDDFRSDSQSMAKLYETASRAVFLRAHVIAKREETHPALGESFRRAAFAVA